MPKTRSSDTLISQQALKRTCYTTYIESIYLDDLIDILNHVKLKTRSCIILSKE